MSKVEIYGIVYSTLCAAALATDAAKGDPEGAGTAIGKWLCTLPLLGRVYGWW